MATNNHKNPVRKTGIFYVHFWATDSLIINVL